MKIYKGLGTAMMRFFDIQDAMSVPRSISQFFKAYQHQFGTPATTVAAAARRFVDAQKFMAVPSKGITPIMDECYFAIHPDYEDLTYGTYDFIAFGFPYIRQHFEASVRALFVTKPDGSETNGSCFVLDGGTQIVTARHCLEGQAALRIQGWNLLQSRLERIQISAYYGIDLALLTFDSPPFPGGAGFRLGEGSLIESVMTLGFPPLPGFGPMLVAETTEIAGKQLFSVGQIVAKEKAYLDQQEYWIISARVKGGSSGGPAISREGKVVGIVSHMPWVDEDPAPLVFGALVPSETLHAFVSARDDDGSKLDVRFEPHDEEVRLKW